MLAPSSSSSRGDSVVKEESAMPVPKLEAEEPFGSAGPSLNRTDVSSDTRFARDHLRALLAKIETGELPPNMPKNKHPGIPTEGADGRRGPGRPRKILKDRKVIFELRGKPFGMRDGDGVESVYSLCRHWMKAREDDEKAAREKEQREREEREEELRASQIEDSVDLLATKEIYGLPTPKSPRGEQRICPENVPRLDDAIPIEEMDEVGSENILKAYQEHWKNVKKSWVSHAKAKNERFYRSINLLETVHRIASQNTI